MRLRTSLPGRLLRGATTLVVRLALALLVIEGTASFIGFAVALPDLVDDAEPERLHMQYDPQLGWSHVPDTFLADFYGPGRDLTINPQGFRGQRTYTQQPPEGRLRAVCAGDQFTLGVGVGDEDTWCARLEMQDPRLETLNLGQGGYGLDQSYLFYERDGTDFETDLLVFAFVRDDFVRMESDTYRRYPKPLLRLDEDGGLDVRNVPVPHVDDRTPWLVRNAPIFEQLRIVQLAQPALDAFGREDAQQLTVAELAELAGGVFEALQRLADQQGATLVLAYLPTRADYDEPGDLWRRRVAREARRRGIAYVDLVEEQRQLSRPEMLDLYAPKAPDGDPDEAPPFSESGNAWVAKALWSRLQRLPELAARLDRTSPPS